MQFICHFSDGNTEENDGNVERRYKTLVCTRALMLKPDHLKSAHLSRVGKCHSDEVFNWLGL